MTQADVYKLMKKNEGKWISTEKIAKRLKIAQGSAGANLRKLLNQGLVMKKEQLKRFGSYLWKLK